MIFFFFGQGPYFFFFSLGHGSPLISTLEMKALKVGKSYFHENSMVQTFKLTGSFNFQKVNDKAMNSLDYSENAPLTKANLG